MNRWMRLIVCVLMALQGSAIHGAESTASVTLSPMKQWVGYGEPPAFTINVKAEKEPVRIMKFGERADLRQAYARLVIEDRDGELVKLSRRISDPGPTLECDYLQLSPGRSVSFAHDGEPWVLSQLEPGEYQVSLHLQTDWRAEPIISKPVSLIVLASSSAERDQLSSSLKCVAPEFSKAQLQAIVARERTVRDDLPSSPDKFDLSVRRQRCHYVYVEEPADHAMHKERLFVIDQYGVIVDFKTGPWNTAKSSNCPKKRFSIEEIMRLVDVERRTHGDLPPPPKNFTPRVIQTRCMYLYSELTESDGTEMNQSLNFTIDQYGAVYSVH